jgi:Protein of unknown function (DUF2778)
MPWIYHQSTGQLVYRAPHGAAGHQVSHVLGRGYSGAPGSVNNPANESIANTGPIPRGRWHIGNMEPHHSHLGPHVMSLTPVGHNAHNRTAFYIHGDNELLNRTASNGCIILGPDIRYRIGHSHDHLLEVVH